MMSQCQNVASSSQVVLPLWTDGGKVSLCGGTALHGNCPGLWFAHPEATAEKLKQAREETRLWQVCFSFFYCQGDRSKWTITVFFVQLTNYVLAQFSLSTIPQSKPNQSNQVILRFLKCINSVCLFSSLDYHYCYYYYYWGFFFSLKESML